MPGAEYIHPTDGISPAFIDRAFADLYFRITASRRPDLAFPDQLAHTLAMLLRQLTEDPGLALLLTDMQPGTHLARSQRDLRASCTRLLREAAARDASLNRHPFPVEPFLLDGVHFLISYRYRCGGPQTLRTLLPSLLEFLLPYYLDPPALASAGDHVDRHSRPGQDSRQPSLGSGVREHQPAGGSGP